MTEPDGSRRCWRCGRKLAELLTPPYYLQCGKCKARNREIPLEQVGTRPRGKLSPRASLSSARFRLPRPITAPAGEFRTNSVPKPVALSPSW